MDLGSGMGNAGGSTPLGKIGAGYGTASHFRPKKSFIRDYEGWTHDDLQRLHGPNPYEGNDIGFSQNQIEGRMGEGVDESQAEFKSDVGNIEREAAAGNMNPLSGAYHRAKQRALEAHLARDTDVRRRNLILDAMQRRQDLQDRLRMTSGAYGQGVNVYNDYADQASRRRGQVYEGIGDLVTYAAMA